MLFNCFNCGKSISSKKDVCVYCKKDVTSFSLHFQNIRPHANIREIVNQKYAGTLFSFLMKTKN